MKYTPAWILTASAALLLGSLVTPARAAVTVLHDFAGSPSDGSDPRGSLALSGSTLYGMTSGGGNTNSGAIFRMNTDGSGYAVLRSFESFIATDGMAPSGSLTVSGSTLYGMTTFGGNGGTGNHGTVFSMNTDGTGFSPLHTFAGNLSDGSHPYGSLTLGGSKLYGMTSDGGGDNFGTIFSMNTDGTGYSVIQKFAGGTGGAHPQGSLTLVGSTLFGMASTEGLAPFGQRVGTIFSVQTDGTGFNLLHSFDGSASDGSKPFGSLTLGGSKLYGVTEQGGTVGIGTVFSMNTDGTGFSLLHSFTGGASDGANPFGSLTLTGSTLHGLTRAGGSGNSRGFGDGNGTLFSIATDGTGFNVLESFGTTIADPAYPYLSDPTISADGATLYGMTQQGGTADGGIIFSRSLVPEPASVALLGVGACLLAGRRRK